MQDLFFGRNRELDILHKLLTKKRASLVVIKGRRRIGKRVSAQHQRKEFANQMKQQLRVTLQRISSNFLRFILKEKRPLPQDRPKTSKWTCEYRRDFGENSTIRYPEKLFHLAGLNPRQWGHTRR